MAATSLQVQHELLAIGFRAYPRGLLSAVAFAALTVALVWPRMGHPLLLVWLGCFCLIAYARYAFAQWFLRVPKPVPDPERWVRRAAFAITGTGIAWGVMGVAAVLITPDVPLYIMWIAFMVVLLAVLGAQTTASHPMVFRSFLFSGMLPIIAVSMIEPAPNYELRLMAEGLLLVVAMLVGRSGNRYVQESVSMRFENVELLRDLERQRAELDRANAAKTRFLAAASHDLRQPMQALVLLVESLKERVRDPTNQRITSSIHSTVESMSVLLNEILDISRLDAGTVAPQRTSFRVAAVLDRLRAAYTFPAARKELALRVRSCDSVISTDPVLLYRILVNLVENALRYTRRGGVLIACRAREEGLWIEVWDTGIGIPKDQFDAIFQEFHQLKNPHRDREQGFGLGLAIVERTARLLQLPLELRSRVEHGSVFRLRVPYGDATQVKPVEVARGPESLEGCRMVVVEDDAEIRAAMTLLLEGWGCTVYAAATGYGLDDILERLPGPPDALIVDYRLPGDETGIDIMLRVRERYPDTFGILVSGDVSPAVLRAAKDADIELLHKPLRPARLRAVLGAMRARAAARTTAANEESA